MEDVKRQEAMVETETKGLRQLKRCGLAIKAADRPNKPGGSHRATAGVG